MESKCSAFWHHTNIRSDDRIFPCCRFKNPIAKFDGNVIEILSLKEYEELRKKSLNGEYISGCDKCYHEESIGKESLRQKFNKDYDTDDISLEYLEIGFDNICNLTCDGCWDEFSSAWSKKNNPEADKTIHIKSTTEIKTIPNSLKKILFLGGEPLMTNRHYKFLNLIENKNTVEVIYNTNGTFLLDSKTIELLKSFKKVEFILSIDGYGDLNDTVRSGSRWQDILSFIEQIKQTSFRMSVNTVLHINNWFGLKELELFVGTLDVQWTVNFLTYPRHLDIINVREKDKLIETLESIELLDLKYIINHVRQS